MAGNLDPSGEITHRGRRAAAAGRRFPAPGRPYDPGHPVDTETFQLFFAVLTLATLAGAVVVTVLRFVAPRSTLLAQVNEAGLFLAWIVALGATLGSLYFSEIANFEPCKLCWFQRIFMYPLAVILGIAAFRRDRGIRWYALPLAGIGLAIALYHYLIERFPDLDSGACSAAVPCTFVWFEEFGFVTLPFMAATAFTFVLAVLTLPAPRPEEP
jgi:disulfide bond formation protein DsbB